MLHATVNALHLHGTGYLPSVSCIRHQSLRVIDHVAAFLGERPSHHPRTSFTSQHLHGTLLSDCLEPALHTVRRYSTRTAYTVIYSYGRYTCMYVYEYGIKRELVLD